MIQNIGLLDERFTGYGFDDDNYCLRARSAGYHTGITRQLRIKHGSGGVQLDRGKNWSCSFARIKDPQSNLEVFRSIHPELTKK
jgi:GT2 family glycosyltransferase